MKKVPWAMLMFAGAAHAVCEGPVKHRAVVSINGDAAPRFTQEIQKLDDLYGRNPDTLHISATPQPENKSYVGPRTHPNLQVVAADPGGIGQIGPLIENDFAQFKRDHPGVGPEAYEFVMYVTNHGVQKLSGEACIAGGTPDGHICKADLESLARTLPKGIRIKVISGQCFGADTEKYFLDEVNRHNENLSCACGIASAAPGHTANGSMEDAALDALQRGSPLLDSGQFTAQFFGKDSADLDNMLASSSQRMVYAFLGRQKESAAASSYTALDDAAAQILANSRKQSDKKLNAAEIKILQRSKLTAAATYDKEDKNLLALRLIDPSELEKRIEEVHAAVQKDLANRAGSAGQKSPEVFVHYRQAKDQVYAAQKAQSIERISLLKAEESCLKEVSTLMKKYHQLAARDFHPDLASFRTTMTAVQSAEKQLARQQLQCDFLRQNISALDLIHEADIQKLSEVSANLYRHWKALSAEDLKHWEDIETHREEKRGLHRFQYGLHLQAYPQLEEAFLRLAPADARAQFMAERACEEEKILPLQTAPPRAAPEVSH